MAELEPIRPKPELLEKKVAKPSLIERNISFEGPLDLRGEDGKRYGSFPALNAANQAYREDRFPYISTVTGGKYSNPQAMFDAERSWVYDRLISDPKPL